MAKVPFTVSARTARLIGQENFTSSDGAIIELVKNSYDADAEVSIVYFDLSSSNPSDHSLYIMDNGHGMSQDIVENQWMQIGTNYKESNYLSELGRVKTGAKGIGRFALDRLGEFCSMLSAHKDSSGIVDWEMDWSQFEEDGKSISNINANVDYLVGEKLQDIISNEINDHRITDLLNKYNFNYGTCVKITKLRDVWNGKEVSSLYKKLEALIPPIRIEEFDIFVFSSSEHEEYGQVSTAYFNEFDYRVEAFYDSKKLTVSIRIERDELDLKKVKDAHLDVFEGKKPPYDLSSITNKVFEYEKDIAKVLKWKNPNVENLKEVGNFGFKFYFSKRSADKRTLKTYPFKVVDWGERRNVLERFGGVKIYRDSFRVRPYGEPGDDWLDLGKREAASPAGPGQVIGGWRVRSSQIAGAIYISRVENSSLIDKSDRNSLIENQAFTTFKYIVIGIISEFEYDRSKISNPFYEKEKIRKKSEKEAEIERKAKVLAKKLAAKKSSNKTNGQKEDEVDSNEESESFEEDIKDAIKDMEFEKDDDELLEEVTIRGLASLGIIVSSSAHELRGIRNNLIQDIDDLKEVTEELISAEVLSSAEENPIQIIEGIKEDHQKLKHWLNYAITGINRDKRNRKDLSFSEYFSSFKSTWQNTLDMKNISIEASGDTKGDQIFRAFEMDMDTIFNNLVSNSMDAFYEHVEIVDRNININWEFNEDKISIVYRDNGPGIPDVFNDVNDIFTPFESSKRDRETGERIGVGLGMYLVKNVIDHYKGDVEIVIPENGFQLNISFPLRKK